jgi:hypothetical protein
MRGYLLAVLALACVPWPASAQNAITQEGTVLQNSPMMFRGNNRARQGAGVGGAPSGQTVTTGDSVVGGRCDYSAPTDAPGGYYKLCVDAAAGRIVLDGTKAPPLGLTVEINGSTYGFPASGTGTGNVVGPNATTINEITSWSNALGTLLRSGPSAVSEKRTGAIAVTGASITGTTNDAVSADQILAYTFCTAPCLPLPAMGGGNYEGVRGVGISTAGTTVPIVAGVSGYVMASQPFVGFGPSSVALFGTGAVNVNGGSVWGVNTNVSDRQYRVAQTSSANRRVVGAEFDVSASFPTRTSPASSSPATRSCSPPTPQRSPSSGRTSPRRCPARSRSGPTPTTAIPAPRCISGLPDRKVRARRSGRTAMRKT